jgi:putative transposase
MSRLRRLLLSGRYFFVTCNLLRTRAMLNEDDFEILARVMQARREEHGFPPTAWVFLPDHWHAICAPQYPLTISEVVKSIKNSSTTLINRGGAASGELWQGRFFDRTLRTVKEYNEKVEYVHLDPVKAGLVVRAQDWRWSSVNEYSGVSATQQMRRCELTIDRVTLPLNSQARI